MVTGVRHAPTIQSTPPQQAYQRTKVLPFLEESSQPWTVSRCHRLLRPLLSHIGALRRDSSLGLSGIQENPIQGSRKRRLPTEQEAAPRKKIRYTYRLKGTKPCDRPSILTTSRLCSNAPNHKGRRKTAGEVEVPTPVLRRVRGQVTSSPIRRLPSPGKSESNSSLPHGYSNPTSRSPLDEELALLRKKIRPSQYASYEGVFRALDTLLKVTTERTVPSTSKSLLGMCLRKVPQLISEQEYWEKKEDEENGTRSAIQGSKVSFEVYSDLESLGAVDGWRHLRTVVRAHGVALVKEAIQEGLLDNTFCGLLLKLLTYSQALLEAGELFTTLLDQQFPDAETATTGVLTGGSTALLLAMTKFAKDNSRESFLFKQLSELLYSSRFPREHMSTTVFGDTWSLAARAISGTQSCDDALSFATASITRLLCRPSFKAGLPGSRESVSALEYSSQATLISILTALAAMVILSQETISRNLTTATTTQARAIVRRVAIIINSCISETKKLRTEDVKPRRYLLHLVLFLSTIDANDQITSPGAAAAVESTWDDLTRRRQDGPGRKQLYDSTVGLVSSVADCCSRATPVESREHLSKLCDHLCTLNLPQDYLKRLRVDSAYMLADRTNDLRDLVFAESLESKRTPTKKGATTAGSGMKPALAGYRWEAGISEWIPVSPVVSKRSRQQPECRGPSSDTTTTRSKSAMSRRVNDTSPSLGISKHDDDGTGLNCWSDDNMRLSSDDEASEMEEQVLRRQSLPQRRAPRRTRRSATRGLVVGGLLSLVPDDELCVEQENLCKAVTSIRGGGKTSRAQGSFSHRPSLRNITNSQTDLDCNQSEDELGL